MREKTGRRQREDKDKTGKRQGKDRDKMSTIEGYLSINKPKMAYSCDLPKMARQQCGIMD